MIHSIEPQDIVVFSFSLAEASRLAEFRSWLSPDECARADRFIVPAVARRFVVCRARVRQLLAELLATSPEKIEFAYGSTGKPRIANTHSNLQFNISHSNDWGLLAVSKRQAVGVDIEAPERAIDMAAFAADFLTQQELSELRCVAESDCYAAMMKAWVAKEALLKGLGSGIGTGLKKVEFAQPLGSSTTPRRIDPELLLDVEDDGSCRASIALATNQWLVTELNVRPNIFAAVAHSKSQVPRLVVS